MMGKQNGQIQIVILDIDSIIPQGHLLRRIKNCVNFDFIYEKAAPYYSNVGRKSIDPVILIKMLLIGYLYGIKSERRRFKDSTIFREIFNEIVLQCIELGIVSGETGVADGSFLPSNVSWEIKQYHPRRNHNR